MALLYRFQFWLSQSLLHQYETQCVYICITFPICRISHWLTRWLEMRTLITVLIGADYYLHFIQDHTVWGNRPTAIQSKLGYLMLGSLQLPQPVVTTNLHVAILHCISQSKGEATCFWNSESPNAADKHLNDNFFNNTWKHTLEYNQMERTACVICGRKTIPLYTLIFSVF